MSNCTAYELCAFNQVILIRLIQGCTLSTLIGKDPKRLISYQHVIGTVFSRIHPSISTRPRLIFI